MSGLDETYLAWESTVYPDGGMCVLLPRAATGASLAQRAQRLRSRASFARSAAPIVCCREHWVGLIAVPPSCAGMRASWRTASATARASSSTRTGTGAVQSCERDRGVATRALTLPARFQVWRRVRGGSDERHGRVPLE